MTTTTDLDPRLDFDKHAGAFAKAMAHLDNVATRELDRVDFDHRLRELVRIRASQLNGCAYCVDMHSKDARAIGETEQRVYTLPAWREAPFYSDRERAALAWTDSLTRIAETHAPDEIYAEVKAQFSDQEIADLTVAIGMINTWNRISIGLRSEHPHDKPARQTEAA